MASEHLVPHRKEEKPQSRLMGKGQAEKAGREGVQNTAPLPRPVEREPYLTILHMGQALLPDLLIQEADQSHAVHVVGVSRGRKMKQVKGQTLSQEEGERLKERRSLSKELLLQRLLGR